MNKDELISYINQNYAKKESIINVINGNSIFEYSTERFKFVLLIASVVASSLLTYDFGHFMLSFVLCFAMTMIIDFGIMVSLQAIYYETSYEHVLIYLEDHYPEWVDKLLTIEVDQESMNRMTAVLSIDGEIRRYNPEKHLSDPEYLIGLINFVEKNIKKADLHI